MCQLLLRFPEKCSGCECDGICHHVWKTTQTGFVGHCITQDKDEFGKAGINTNVYTTHSYRAASTSKARGNRVSVTEDMKKIYV